MYDLAVCCRERCILRAKCLHVHPRRQRRHRGFPFERAAMPSLLIRGTSHCRFLRGREPGRKLLAIAPTLAAKEHAAKSGTPNRNGGSTRANPPDLAPGLLPASPQQRGTSFLRSAFVFAGPAISIEVTQAELCDGYRVVSSSQAALIIKKRNAIAVVGTRIVRLLEEGHVKLSKSCASATPVNVLIPIITTCAPTVIRTPRRNDDVPVSTCQNCLCHLTVRFGVWD
jgi:hypothetical protein